MFEIKKAIRSQAKLKIGVSAPSGAGKTMSALLLAQGLTGDLSKVCVIDTENDSASLYSHLGDFSTVSLKQPYSPQRYVAAINAVVNSKQFELVIVDSVSHEWDGPGGCLEIHENLGGQFRDWAKVTPMHRSFIDAIVHAPIHMITTVRRKQDYAMEQNDKGKAQPKKVGLKEVQRDGFEYELTVNFDIEMNHMALASKDRTGLFSSKVPFIIGVQTGKMIAEWNNSGSSPVPPPPPPPENQQLREPARPAAKTAPPKETVSPPSQAPAAQPPTNSTKPPKAALTATLTKEQADELWAFAVSHGYQDEEIMSVVWKFTGKAKLGQVPVVSLSVLKGHFEKNKPQAGNNG